MNPIRTRDATTHGLDTHTLSDFRRLLYVSEYPFLLLLINHQRPTQECHHTRTTDGRTPKLRVSPHLSPISRRISLWTAKAHHIHHPMLASSTETTEGPHRILRCPSVPLLRRFVAEQCSFCIPDTHGRAHHIP
jgi:hypothetical protein